MPCIDSIALEIKEKRKAEENTDCASIYFTHKAMSIVRSALFKKKKKIEKRWGISKNFYRRTSLFIFYKL